MPAASFTSIGIVFAMEIETRGLRSVLSNSRRVHSKHPATQAWQLGTRRVTAVVSGIGPAKAAAATEAAIDSGARAIINAGFAAALDGKAAVGDVVVGNRVMRTGPDGPVLQCDRALSAAIPPSGSLGYSVWQSDVISANRIIFDPDEKRSIYQTTGAAALDMECYAAAEVCARRGVPFFSIKAVSDTASKRLPEELADVLKQRSAMGTIWFVFTRPHLWHSLWSMRSDALKASRNLGDAIGTMLLRISNT